MKPLLILSISLILISCTASNFEVEPKGGSSNTVTEVHQYSKSNTEKKEQPRPAPAQAPIGMGIMSGPVPRITKSAPSERDAVMVMERSNKELAANAMPVPQANSNKNSKGDKDLKQLTENASLAFSMKEQANFHDRIRAQLIVDIDRKSEELVKELTVKGKITKAEMKSTKVIMAELSAPDFEIEPRVQTEQAILEGNPAIFDWYLKPKSKGTFDVTLRVFAKVKIDGSEKSTLIKTFEKVITVEITPQEELIDWAKKKQDNILNWLWTVLLFPGVIWLKNKFKKNKT